LRDGKGTLTFPENRGLYEGEFKSNNLNGQGKMTYGDGAVYIGEFRNGLRDGKGTLTYPNEAGLYIGEFRNNLSHGKGALSLRNGMRYEGQFVSGFPSGHGTYSFPNGTRLVGDFEKGLPGGGTLVLRLPDGTERRWDVKDGVPTEVQDFVDGIKM